MKILPITVIFSLIGVMAFASIKSQPIPACFFVKSDGAYDLEPCDSSKYFDGLSLKPKN